MIPKRDCPRACKNPETAKLWGCRPGTKSKFPVTVECSDGSKEKIWRCPYALLRETDVWQVFYYFRQYRQGHLPATGGVLDQPIKLMEAIDLLACLLPKYEEEMEEKERAPEKMAEKLKAKSETDGREN